ncbi:hypothetical protein [Anaerocolumna sp. MB42-C2]|uniref:hypothetical protein n=1 Tax=Anaerocolumna sp. MB42-C2 TaxID=3070997 RepID=UPI0027DEE964|nr:hypothetical protein [Anaerocolumna sp. MB42-C2]WMJ89505.1 hypothetical protein RBU59_08270 [Anaerocolumna sp. MB42-C2]
MKKSKGLLLVTMVLILLLSGYPATSAKAAFNTLSAVMYEGQDYNYNFLGMGKIEKVTYSNKKAASTVKIEDTTLYFKANKAGATTITVKGKAYTYTIKLTVKKTDITASFVKKLQDGTYLVKITNKTKDGYVEYVSFATVLRSSDGGFLKFDDVTAAALNPGATVYETYEPDEDYNVDLSKSTLELNEFEIDTGLGIKFTDCTKKMIVTDAKGGKVAPGDTNFTFSIKNNNTKVAANTYYTIAWYDANGNTVKVENINPGYINPKEESKITAYVPDQEYGVVSYKITVRAYSKVYPPKKPVEVDIPHIK